MEFIDKLKEVGSETYKYTAQKTTKIAKETKLRLKISQNKSKIEDIYQEIGKAVYEDHIREEETGLEEKIEKSCMEIDILAGEIEEIQKELLTLKNRRKCIECDYQMNVEDKFCPKCGRKQPEDEVKQAEFVEEDTEDKIIIDKENDEIIEEENIEDEQ